MTAATPATPTPATEQTGRVRKRRTGGRAPAYALALLAPLALAALLLPWRADLSLASTALLLLLVVTATSLLGGRGPALAAAAWAALLLNLGFTQPFYRPTVAEPANLVALVVFALVAATVATLVDRVRRSERAAAETAALAARAESLAEVDRLRTAILAAVAHDLRTPLAAAKASVTSLASPETHDSLDEGDRERLLAAADTSLDRLAALVSNLLDLSRLQAGVLALRLQPTDVDDVLAAVLDSTGDAGPRVRLDLPAAPPLLLADGGLLERVLDNLLANAARYSPRDAPPELRVRGEGSWVEIEVVDHGPGIPAEAREAAFVPFQRLGDTDTTTGLGLGLALARGLTEAMGGTLTAHETAGGGLTLRVRLAAADAATTPGRRERAQR